MAITVVFALIVVALRYSPGFDAATPGPVGANRVSDDGVDQFLLEADDLGRNSPGLPDATAERSVALRSGQLVLLDIAGRSPVIDEAVRLNPIPSDLDGTTASVEGRTDPRGIIAVPAGRWTVSFVENRYAPLDDSFEVGQGTQTILFVSAVGKRTFLLTDLADQPLEGIRGLWTPPESSEGMAGWIFVATSDKQGLLEFGGCPVSVGIATFTGDDVERAERVVSGASNSVIHVKLRPTARDGRQMAVESAVDGTPLNGPQLVDPRTGMTISSAPAGSNVLDVPPWCELDDRLVVRGATVFPSGFRLRDLSEDALPAWPVGVLRVLVRGPATTDRQPILLWTSMDLEGGVTRPGPTTPHCPQNIAAFVNIAQEIQLPMGIPLIVGASDRNGRSAVVHVTLTNPGQEAELVLDAGGLEITVVDDAGSPIRSAWATASVENDVKSRIQSDERGRLYVPARTRWLLVGADGFLAVRIERSLPCSPDTLGLERLLVSLTPSVSAIVHVSDSSDVSMSGVQVTAYPTRPSAASAAYESGWRTRVVKEASGVTDGNGRVRLYGLAEDLYTFRTQLPDVFSTDLEYRGMLFKSVQADVVIRGGIEIRLRCSAPRAIALEVSEASSGLPVAAFLVRDPELDAEVPVSGNYWQGWVRAECTTLQVSVPAIGSAVVQVPPDIEGPLTVRVSPSELSSIRIRGLPDDVSRLPLYLAVFRQASSALVQVANIRLEWNVGSDIPLCLPLEGDLVIRIEDIVLHGQSWEFSPAERQWQLGGLLEFQARPES